MARISASSRRLSAAPVGVNSRPGRTTPRRSIRRLAVGNTYKDRGIDVSLELYVFPSAAYIDALADAVLAIDHLVGVPCFIHSYAGNRRDNVPRGGDEG